jgi:RHS repeat-associated protein
MRRVRKTVAGTTTYFLWSGSELIEEYDGAGDRRVQYIYGAEYGPVHIRADNALRVETVFDVHMDHLSTPRLVTDPSEVVVWRAEYASFGEVSVDSSSSLTFNVRLPGQYVDGETRLHYNRFRYYSPSTGRYTSVDPLAPFDDLNLYAYSQSSPLSFSDPLGLFSLEESIVGSAAAAIPLDGRYGKCLADCIDGLNLGPLSLVPPLFSRLPKEFLPPFRVIPTGAPGAGGTTILSSIAGSLSRGGYISSSARAAMRSAGRGLSKVATPITLSGGAYSYGIIGYCSVKCLDSPCSEDPEQAPSAEAGQ